MSNLSDKKNLLADASCAALTEDCEEMLRARHRISGVVLPSADEVLAFLDGYNAFINHARRPFEPIHDAEMKL